MLEAAVFSELWILLYQTTRRDILVENDLYCRRSKHRTILQQLAGVRVFIEVNYIGEVEKFPDFYTYAANQHVHTSEMGPNRYW